MLVYMHTRISGGNFWEMFFSLPLWVPGDQTQVVWLMWSLPESPSQRSQFLLFYLGPINTLHSISLQLGKKKKKPMCHDLFAVPEPMLAVPPCALKIDTEQQNAWATRGMHSWMEQSIFCLLVWHSSCKQESLHGMLNGSLVFGLLIYFSFDLCAFLWVIWR